MSANDTPLVGPPPKEVPLPRAPLVRVIAQVRFPPILSVEKRDFIAPFQEAVRTAYPVLRPEQSRAVVFGPQGVDARMNTLWRFADASNVWRLTLAPDFFTLETTKYTSRADFFERFERALRALVAHVNPGVFVRLGVRYVDRLTGAELDELQKLVRPEMCGVLATTLRDQVNQAISESIFEIPDERGQLMARWGLLPPRSTVDPAAVEPVDERSWLLDVDAFRAEAEPQALDVDDIVARGRGFAERIYTVFRWAVEDEFLRRFGGQP